MVAMWCTITSSSCVLYMMLKRDIMVDASRMETLNFSFCKLFLKISNQIGRARCNHHLACDCPPLCQIWGHLKICMKFGNLNLELFWNLDAPICQNMRMLSRGHPWKYDHACPWSSRLNPTINIMFGNDRSGCEASFLKSCQTHLFSVTMETIAG